MSSPAPAPPSASASRPTSKFQSIGDRFERGGKWIPVALAIASAMVLMAVLTSQYFAHARPCILCISQRYPYVIAVVLGTLTALFYNNVMARVLLLAVMTIAFCYGAGVGIFHTLVQGGLIAGDASCGGTLISTGGLEHALTAPELAANIRCSEAAWSLLGLSMPAYNVLVSSVLGMITGLAAWFSFDREA